MRSDATLTAVETSSQLFRRAQQWIDRCPALPIIERDLVSKVGRPRDVPWRAVLVLYALAALHTNSEVRLTKVERIVAGLRPSQRQELGLKHVGYSHITRSLQQLHDALQERVDTASGEISHRRLSLTTEELCIAIVRATLPPNLDTGKRVAVDATDFETWARRRSRRSHIDRPTDETANEPGWPKTGPDGRYQHSADPDARDGYRSGKNKAAKEIFHGYDVLLASLPARPGQENPPPPLALGFVLTPAGDSKADGGLRLIDTLRSRGQHVDFVTADRGFTIARTPTWAEPLWNRRIEQILDLHTNQRGVRPGPKPGMIMVDGGLFLDTLPDHLRRLPGYKPGMSETAKARLAATYDKRIPYAFTAYGPRDPVRLTQRYRGPARTGRIRCPNVPASMRKSPERRPTTSCKPGSACACGAAPTLGPDDSFSLRQTHLYGTTAWRAEYGLRNAVESGNAAIKTHHVKIARGSTRVFGTTKNAILLAFLIGVANIEMLRSRYGYDSAEPPGDQPLAPIPKPRKSPLHHKVFRRRSRAPASGDPPDRPPITWLPLH